MKRASDCASGSNDEPDSDATLHWLDASNPSDDNVPSESDGQGQEEDDDVDDEPHELHAVNLKRPRTVLGGSAAYFDATDTWPKGPSNVQEIADWPAHVCRNFFKGDAGKRRQARVFKMLERGLVTHCDYGGRQGPEVSLKMLAAEFKGCGLPNDWLVQWRYTEVNKCVLNLVKNSPNPPTHVIPGVQCLLDIKTLNAIRAVRPHKKAPPETRASAYRQMDLIIQNAAPQMFGPEATCLACLTHENFGGGGDCVCRTTWRDSRSEKERATTCAIAGPLCTPFSSYGKRESMSHVGTEPWHIYSRKVASEKHDLTFLENSPRMPIKLFEDKMGDSFVVVHATYGPEDLAIHPSLYPCWIVFKPYPHVLP
jgi:hypothetical protein